LDGSTKELSKAIDKLAQTAGTIAGGKTASDMATVSKFDSPEQYAESQAKTASAQASKDHGKLLLDKDQESNDNFMKKLVSRTADGDPKKKEAAIKKAQEMGLLVSNDKGELHAPVGTAFSDALGRLSAGDMGRDKQFQFMGTSFNVDRSSDGETRFQNTSQQTHAHGEKRDSGSDMGVAKFYARKIAPEGASEEKINEIAGSLNDSADFAKSLVSEKGVVMTSEAGAISAAKIYDQKNGTHYADRLTDKLKTATEQDNPGGIIGDSLNGHSAVLATVGAEALYQGTKMIPGTSHKGTLVGKVGTGAARTLKKVSPFNSIREKESPNSPNQGDNTKTDSGIDEKVDKQHGKSSFEGTKYNMGGGNTKEYQTHLDSIAKNAKRAKYVKDVAKVAGKGVVGAVVSYAAEESLGWASQSALNQGNYRTSNLLSAGENTIKGFGNVLGAGITGFGGGIMTGVEKTFGVDIGAKKAISMSNEMLNTAGTQGATAMLNVSDMVTGTKSVVGKTRQPLSMTATNSMLSNGISSPKQAFTPLTTNGPIAQIPSYAQNAFRTPPMGNTIGAMGGTNAYNNSMNQVNTGGPASNKTDTQFQHLDKLSDIDMSNEGIVEAMEDLKKYYEEGE